MSAETALHAAINAAATSATCIRPNRLKQGDDLPAVVYQRVSTAPLTNLQGDAGLDAVRLQVSCWADSYAAAKTLGGEVRAAVLGALNAVTEMIIDDQDEATRTHRVIIDFRIWE